jgi:hypothetical protein
VYNQKTCFQSKRVVVTAVAVRVARVVTVRRRLGDGRRGRRVGLPLARLLQQFRRLHPVLLLFFQIKHLSQKPPDRVIKQKKTV